MTEQKEPKVKISFKSCYNYEKLKKEDLIIEEEEDDQRKDMYAVSIDSDIGISSYQTMPDDGGHVSESFSKLIERLITHQDLKNL